MAKYAPEFAIAVALEESNGDFNTALETAVETNQNADDTHGLILGSAGAGQFDSGIDLTVDRVFSDKARLGGAFTRPLSNYLALEASTFTFATDMVGNRVTGAVTVDADLTPSVGLNALLGSCYLRSAGWGTGLGWEYKAGISGDVLPAACGYVWAQGERMKFKGARSTLALAQTPQEIGQAVFTISPGEILALVAGDLTDLAATSPYGLQTQIGAANVVSVGNAWGATRGWSDCTFNLSATIDDIPDSNAVTGVVKEPSDFEATLDVTLYKDDGNAAFEASQLQEDDAGNLVPFGWQVGSDATVSTPRLSYRVNFPTPELQSQSPAPQGVSSASTLSLVGRSQTAGEEFSLVFV